jgi:hypothetical protein
VTSTLSAHGLALTVHDGWEALIWMPDLPPPAENHPVIRLANFALPLTKNTYAEDVADGLRAGEVVASLAEFSPTLADRGLYAPRGVPDLEPKDLDPRAVQRQAPGRAGVQRFFSAHARAFSLYVVARRGPGLDRAMHDLTIQLRGLTVGTR